MTVGNADLHKAVNTVWDASEILDGQFKQHWSGVTNSEYVVLHDGEASEGQPFPYCVYEIAPGLVTERSRSVQGSPNEQREIQDVPLQFRVHAKQTSTQSAKQVASDLAENILKTFGGHPTTRPTRLILDNGNCLLTRLNNNYGVRTGSQHYQWVVDYTVRLDVPVAI